MGEAGLGQNEVRIGVEKAVHECWSALAPRKVKEESYVVARIAPAAQWAVGDSYYFETGSSSSRGEDEWVIRRKEKKEIINLIHHRRRTDKKVVWDAWRPDHTA